MSDEQIFISYSRKNKAQAEDLIRVLQSNMWSVWLDEENIPISAKYREEILKALDGAKCVVVLWSKDSVKSDWVRSEADKASKAKKLLPVRIDNANIPMPFDELEIADLTTWDGNERENKGLQRLLSSISMIVKPMAGSTVVGERQSLSSSDMSRTLVTLSDDPWTGAFDEVYIVSDLNLVSPDGLQVMNQADRLAKFIDHLTHVRVTDRVALVINGDLIDFASEEFEGLVATREAVAILEKVWGTKGLRFVWERLAAFLQTPRRYLIIILGEKDMELALPEASEAIINKLTGGDISARGRMTLVGLSASYKCRVGHANVLCKHGHDVDPWNAVDYGLLSQIGDQQTDGVEAVDSDLIVNAGRLMRRKYLNSVSRRYPFAALLQPEQAVVSILLALEPSIVLRNLMTWMPQVQKKLFYNRLKERTRPYISQVDVESTTGEVGLLSSILCLFSGKQQKAERLRNSLLNWLAKDTTFTLTTKDSQFAEVVGRVGTNVDFIAVGHTHLERAIKIGNESRCYYNTGTWTSLLRFNHGLLSSAEAFAKVFETIPVNDISALDDLVVPLEDGGEMPFLLHRPTVLRISSQPRGVVGQLFHVFDSGHDAVRLEPLAGTEFWKK